MNYLKLNLFALVLLPFSVFPTVIQTNYEVSLKANDAVKKLYHSKEKPDIEALRVLSDSYKYFSANATLMKKMQPSVSKEILYFQTLSEDEKSDYIIKARTSRAVMVAAGAVLTAIGYGARSGSGKRGCKGSIKAE